MSNISRRSFVAGAAVTAAAAAAAPAIAEEAAGKWSFEIAPEPIADDQVAQTYVADIVVVGAGLAGVVTAVSAAEAGASVILVTASSTAISRGGSNFGLNSVYQQEKGIQLSDDQTREMIHTEQQLQSMLVDGQKWSYFFNNSTEFINWEIEKLTAKGLNVSLEPGYTDPMGTLTVPACSHNFWDEEHPWGFMSGAPLQRRRRSPQCSRRSSAARSFTTPS